MRQLTDFACDGETLIGTLDAGAFTTGLLIVSGGSELRCGAHRGMALLAHELADMGVPVFRFDRRGIGDSSGTDRGYAESAPDIAAAAAHFRALQPQLTRIIGFGNCDAATALALFHRDAGIDALVLANPWVGDEEDGLPPAEAIGAHYAGRLRDPRQWARALTGGVNIGKAVKGLLKLSRRKSESSNPIARAMLAALGDTPCTILLAERDNTAIRFRRDWTGGWTTHARDTDSHSFARSGDQDWLRDRLREAIGAPPAQ